MATSKSDWEYQIVFTDFIKVPENPGLLRPGMNGSLEQTQTLVSA
jgi:hypothetical protein